MELKQLRYAIMDRVNSYIPDFIADRMVSKFIREGGVSKTIYSNEPFGLQIENEMDHYLTREQRANEKFAKSVLRDVIKCRLLYGAQAYEYFLYGFQHADKKVRRDILTRRRKDGYYIRSIGSDWRKYYSILKDKFAFYSLCGEYFGRDACKVKDASDAVAFNGFCDKHKKFIVKPYNGQCGRGVEIVDLMTSGKSQEELFGELLSAGGGVIVEELVQQSNVMAQWNASSVNTVRLPSYRTANGYISAYPFVRTGRAGSVVDNAGSGGVFAVVDEKTGVILTDGYDERGGVYKTHPDSHLTFQGWQLPDWKSLIELSHRVHAKLPPQLKYVGFDFAHTDSGWVLIEGNWGEFVQQGPLKRGLRKEFLRLMGA